MKGIVFSEFCRMVEGEFSAETLDELIDDADLPSGGAYTTVGTYDHRELLTLVGCLAHRVDAPADALVCAFGHHMMDVFNTKFPKFFEVPDAFTFLESIDQTIHIEVRKLYSDSELPSFACRREDGALIMEYSSSRPFAALAHGLIEAALIRFGETGTIEREDLSPDGTHARFTVRHQ